MSMTQHEPEIAALREPDVKRRGMLSGTGLRAAATAAIGAGLATAALTGSTPAQAQAVTDVDILNFALNLEYLEAEFYLRAVTGTGLAATDVTGTTAAGTVNGGGAVPFTSYAIQQYAQVLAADEQAHVRFLRAALQGAGATPVARPNIDFTNAFNTLAAAAGIIQPGGSFNPFAGDLYFLLGAFVFEDVGVTAYAGASGLISNKAYLTAAAAILGVEAYHAGAIRTLISTLGLGAEANAISNLRATLGGGNEQGVIIPGLNNNFAAADGTGLAFRRTTTQVLNIVYGNTTKTPGLFFPNGTNGNIR